MDSRVGLFCVAVVGISRNLKNWRGALSDTMAFALEGGSWRFTGWGLCERRNICVISVGGGLTGVGQAHKFSGSGDSCQITRKGL